MLFIFWPSTPICPFSILSSINHCLVRICEFACCTNWTGQTGFALSLENYSSLVTTDFVENSPHRDTSISGVFGVQRGPASSGGLVKNCGSNGRDLL